VDGVATLTAPLHVVVYDTPGLGDRSYLVHDGKVGAVIDAQRDPAPYLATAAGLGVEIALVLETHIHNDYVSGGLALARRAAAAYGVPAGEQVQFAAECDALDEGDARAVGGLALTVLATPGHTPHHLSYLIEDGQGSKVVLTGGSLLAGATGRTDLLGAERAAELAAAQWRSVRRLLSELPPGTGVLSTHGFGSFCSVGADVEGPAGELTIAAERAHNPAARLELEAFVESLGSDALPVPAYYRYMAPLNRAGAPEPGTAPVPALGPAAWRGLQGAGVALVDIRGRRAFGGAHWRGSLNIELGPSLPVYLGWLLPFTTPVALVSPDLDEVTEARRLLASIGRETLAGWALADLIASLRPDESGHYQVGDFHQLAERLRHGPFPSVLDVRFAYEWRSGHIAGARNVPLPEVPSAAPALPGDQEIWVHCAGGYRAAIAASMLSGRGLRPVLIDDTLDNAVSAGLEVIGGP
jgi:glyoxylase-like metal-dependent hydrolase (beta-lactamase superfamily II)/rhodanese-related sulfurtransferase